MPNRERQGNASRRPVLAPSGMPARALHFSSSRAGAADHGERPHVCVPQDAQPFLAAVAAEQPVAAVEEPLRVDRPRQHQQRRHQDRPHHQWRQRLPRRHF
ncbi:MAG: hypothetical protein OXG61_13755 [Chloroflexi bacterium]|nr:hypothetical protein [Chloroflexota bacterium]